MVSTPFSPRFLWVYSQEWCTDHMVAIVLVLWGTPVLIFTVAGLICTLSVVHKGCSSHILSSTCFLNGSHSDWGEVMGFDLHFSHDEKMFNNFFICILAICNSSFEHCLFTSFTHYWLDSLGLGFSVFKFIMCSKCESFVRCIYSWLRFSPFFRLSLHLVNISLLFVNLFFKICFPLTVQSFCSSIQVFNHFELICVQGGRWESNFIL